MCVVAHQEMQASGRRCVTCFCRASELGREWVDSYPPFAAKDSLHFMMHDLQHVEKLVAPAYYCEQVGFLYKMRAVYAWAKPQAGQAAPELPVPSSSSSSVVSDGDGHDSDGEAGGGGGGSVLMREDKELRADIAHLVSDMNTCCAHMMDFLLAKWWGAASRYRERQQHSHGSTSPSGDGAGPADNNGRAAAASRQLLEEELSIILDLLVADGLPGRVLGTPPPLENSFDSVAVRAFFRSVGCAQLAREIGCEQQEEQTHGELLAMQRGMEGYWPAMLSEKEQFFSALVDAEQLE